MISDGAPFRPRSGAQLRTLAILKALCRLGSVSSVSLGDPAQESSLAIPEALPLERFQLIENGGIDRRVFTGLNMAFLGRFPARRLLSWRKRDELRQAVAFTSPDLVVLESSYLAPLAPFVEHGGGAVAVDCHNFDSRLYWEQYRMNAGPMTKLRRYSEYAGYRRTEGSLNEVADQVWIPTSEERARLEASGVSRVFQVPTAVDVSEYIPAPGVLHSIGFPGSLWYPPNQEAVTVLLDYVFPGVRKEIPDAKIVIAGSRPPEWIRRRASGSVSVMGDVPDMRSILSGVSIVAVPLLRGGGTKLKILESMAMGKVVVTTPKGAEGLDVKGGQDIIIRPVGDFPRAIVEAWRDWGNMERIARNARRLVEDVYSVEALTDSLKKVLGELGRA